MSCRLLVTAYDSLTLLGPNGVELARISSPGLEGLQHAIETPRGTFVVCHLKPELQVSEITVDGHVIRTCNSSQVRRPRYLSLALGGRIIVADAYKHRILLLNSRLGLERVLLSAKRDGVAQDPMRLYYIEHAGQLVICSWKCNSVQVFNVCSAAD